MEVGQGSNCVCSAKGKKNSFSHPLPHVTELVFFLDTKYSTHFSIAFDRGKGNYVGLEKVKKSSGKN
jgi:hypothetical protein